MTKHRNICVKNAGEYTYVLTESITISEDDTTVKVYGIIISGCEETKAVDDIYDEENAVRDLYDLIVEEKLSPVHLYDVAEDFINEKSGKCDYY